MKLRGRCDGCKKDKWFIKRREYRIKVGGLILSQNELCGKCYKGIKESVKDQLI